MSFRYIQNGNPTQAFATVDLNDGVVTGDWVNVALYPHFALLLTHADVAAVVTYTIDGSAPSSTAAFTIDDAEVVVPFLYFLQDTDIAGTVELCSKGDLVGDFPGGDFSRCREAQFVAVAVFP